MANAIAQLDPGAEMPRRSLFSIVAASMVFSLATVASAQGTPDEEVIQEPDRVVYKPFTKMDFGNAFLEGDLARPEGEYSLVRKKTRFRNLIEMRAHFRVEMRRGVSGL